MTTPHILLLGGHGKVSQLLTPLLLSRSWTVTSLIRAADQKPTIESLGRGQPGKLNVYLSSLEDIKTSSDAKKIVDEVKPNWIVWSAGAGGKGGPERTKAIDRDACIAFLKATHETSSVAKFLLVSYLGSRRNKPSWWSNEEWKGSQEVNEGALKNYFKAKVESDEYLASVALARGEDFAGICLRPGRLTEEGVENVQLGKTRASGEISRATVAEVAARLLESGYETGWVDMLNGDEEVGKAVERVTKEKVDCIEGENVEKIKSIVSKI